MCAPRRRACSSSSRMRMHPPSPITKPSRRRSNGRDARCGSSFPSESASLTPQADAMTVFLIEIEPGVFQREVGRCQRQLREAIPALRVLAAKPLLGVKVFDLGSDFPVAKGFFKDWGAINAGHARADVFPKRLDANPDGAD